MSKKFLALLLSAMCVFMLCACGNNNATVADNQSADSETAAVADIDKIKQAGVLVVGVTDFEPMDYIDADGKTLSELDTMALSLKDRFSKFPESVENLIKLIRLRILAENIGIFSIKEVMGEIRIYSPFNFQEWLIIKNKADKNVTKYFTFQKPPKSLTDVSGILIMNKSNHDFDEIFNILGDLFYHVSSIILEFNKNNN